MRFYISGGAILALGGWLVVFSFIVSHESRALFWSDFLCGLLAVILSGLWLSARRGPLICWAVALLGLWLLFAPLIFWAPKAEVYLNDLLLGSLFIAFSVLIPGLPGEKTWPGSENPPGWDYNPSTWWQRMPIIIVALLGFFASSYLAFYQLGYLEHVWDPFFGEGTRRVLESDVSKSWPVSDAGLGAAAYLIEALSGFLGGTRRWQTAPWAVIVFGILVVPVGIVSIALVILQPVAVGFWCTLCLITAFLTLIMISPAFDEVIATGQFLLQSFRGKEPLRQTLFKGGPVLSNIPEMKKTESWREKLMSGVSLVNVPWNLFLSAVLGVWLMASPYVLKAFPDASGHNEQLTGALVITAAVIAFGEVMRPLRLVNILFGGWLMLSPWILGAPGQVLGNDLLCGIVLISLSFRRGDIQERHGSWDQFIL